jgi:hypothetical protein
MTSSPDEDGVEERLRTLMARGFRFMHPRSAGGALVAVVGFRTHDGVVDVVALRAADDAKASRVSAEEPDVLAPSETLWETRGSAAEVVDAVLSLPEPTGADVAGATRGCWISRRPGTLSWIAAS